MHPRFDEKDAVIRKERLEAWDKIKGPRVGDYVVFPGEEEPRRFTYHWGDSIQTTCRQYGGSFYFGDGYMSFSGSLDPSVLIEKLENTGQIKGGHCWFFHHNWAEAHNGVGTTVPCRVYRFNP